MHVKTQIAKQTQVAERMADMTDDPSFPRAAESEIVAMVTVVAEISSRTWNTTGLKQSIMRVLGGMSEDDQIHVR